MVNIRDLTVAVTKDSGIDGNNLENIISMLENYKKDDTSELKEMVKAEVDSKYSSTIDELLSKYNQLRQYFILPEKLTERVVVTPNIASVVIPQVHVATDYAALARKYAQMAAAEEEEEEGIDVVAEKTSKKKKETIVKKVVEKKVVETKKETREMRELRKRSRKLSKKATAHEKAEFINQELEAELADQDLKSTHARRKMGRFNGALEASSFTLANPGGGAPLLENASCTLIRGRRYGLIGRNGKGKSTMLRALAARRVGSIPDNVTVHYVSQDINLSEENKLLTPVDIVLNGDIERKLLLEEESELSTASELTLAQQERLNEIIEQLEIIESSSAERRAIDLLNNLGFSEEMRTRPLSALSGGWRVRTFLAAAIFAKPDLLLLDEPTNHLSILAVLWLARELSTNEIWKDRIIVIVSHDRYFIDEVCSDCLHISGVAKRLTQHHGNYSMWADKRREQQITLARETEKKKDEIETLKEYAGHGFKYGGSSTQVTQMTRKAAQAEKLEEEILKDADEFAALKEDIELPIKLDSGGEIDGFVIQLMNVSFGYPGSKELFKNADFGVTSKSRIVLLGENGNGKTTLVKLMLGELKPTAGEVRRVNNVRFALVNQHHADQIDIKLTPLEFMLQKFPGDGSNDHTMKLRGHLSSCGVTSGVGTADLQNVPCSALSGGQKSRVALSAVSYSAPHVLFLDEPTNNLDLESVSALADSVKSFKGAVVVVSHDQFFVTEVSNEAWVVNKGSVKKVTSFKDYRDSQLKKLK